MTLNRRSKTIIGVLAMTLFSLIALYAANFFTKEESIDPRSSANTGNQGGTEYGTNLKYQMFNGEFDSQTSFNYLTAANANFSWVTAPNVHLWSIHREGAEVYTWENTDYIIDWASSNSKKVTLHALLWNNTVRLDNVQWYMDLSTETEKLQALERHIFAVMDRYKDDADAIHVINHAVRHNGNGDYMGTGLSIEDMTVRVFQQVNAIDTDITYLVNAETRVITSTEQRDKYVAYINTVNSQLDEHSKIDAIGIMGHLGYCNGAVPDVATMKSNIDYIYTQTGVPIWITELDISYDGAGTDCSDDLLDPRVQYDPGDGSPFNTWFEYQKDRYKLVVTMLKNNPGVENITFWGFYDGLIWRKHAGLFFGPDDQEGDFTPKPAYTYLKPTLCTSQCTTLSCGFDGCGGSCGTCNDGKVCIEGECGDPPPEDNYATCKSLVSDKTDVDTKDEKIKFTITGESGDGSEPLKLTLLAAAGGQTNKKPEDFLCDGADESSAEYSFYCNSGTVWKGVGEVSNTKEFVVEKTFQELADLIDLNISDGGGKEYSGTLEDNGIVLSADVRGTSDADLCSGNIARNSGEGTYYNGGTFDKACVGNCNLLIEFNTDDGGAKQCKETCDDENPCDTGLQCEGGVCRNEQCPKNDDEDCTCLAGPQDRPADVNEDTNVDMLDISQVLSVWGDTVDASAREDVNDDLTIDLLDISMIIGDWD